MVGLAAALLATAATLSPHQVVHAAPIAKGAQQKDPCGLRYAAWGVTQEIATFVSDVVAGRVDDFATLERTNYVNLHMTGVESDYGFIGNGGRNLGTKKLDKAMSSVLGDVEAAVQQHDQGDDNSSALAGAQHGMGAMWRAVKQFCPWKGKSFTWTGYLEQFGYQSTVTRAFTAPKRWAVDYWFECPDSTFDAATPTPGNFIIQPRGNDPFLLSAANDLAPNGGGLSSRSYPHGAYSLQIISECAWQVKVVPI